MAYRNHLDILKLGVKIWNAWRKTNPDILPILGSPGSSKLDLSGMDLSGADLSFAYLSDINFRKANLNKANLSFANLFRSNLSYTNLRGADLSFAGLMLASLYNADLTSATLVYANVTHANFSRAKLFGALALDVNFNSVKLKNTDFTNAVFAYTSFSNTDLSTVKGLDTIRYRAPSSIGIDAVYQSEGKIPDAFLRGAGVPESFIMYMPSLVGKAFDFYSCFISYSTKNQAFADRLYADLQAKGVRCWLASEDLKIGDKIRLGIDESIRKHDKLLLILSKQSIVSDWVEKEVEAAFEMERNQRRIVLVPIRVDDTVMKIQNGWPADIRRTRNIGDFRQWKRHDEYSKAFDRLLRDLQPVDTT